LDGAKRLRQQKTKTTGADFDSIRQLISQADDIQPEATEACNEAINHDHERVRLGDEILEE
jgi:hypothetical protein